MNMEQQWNDIDKEKLRTRTETCPNANFSATNTTWTGLGVSSDRGEKPTTIRLSYGTTS
jgi:hypothetical protein